MVTFIIRPCGFFGIPGVSDPMGFETNVQALESADVEVAGGSEVGWLVDGSWVSTGFLLGDKGKKHETNIVRSFAKIWWVKPVNPTQK